MSNTVDIINDRYKSGSTRAPQAVSESSSKNAMGIDMTDFLLLMVAQFQNQTIDNTADTSDMLNQLVQMQMVEALTNMTDATMMTYAASLVGKEVTIGSYDSDGRIQEIVGTVTGTGTSGGELVVFVNDTAYRLNEIMAVGHLPELQGPTNEEIMELLEGTEHAGTLEKLRAGEDISYLEYRSLISKLEDLGAISADEYRSARSCGSEFPDSYTDAEGNTIPYEGADRFKEFEVWTSGSKDPVEYLDLWIDRFTGWYGELSELKNEDGSPKYSDLEPIDRHLDELAEVAGLLKELTAK